MTDLMPYQPSADIEPASDRPMRLVEWAQEARAANYLAKSLCRTEFAGQYRGNEDGATAAILKGAEVGLTPVTSLGAFDLIQGTPAPKALTLRALVQAHGHAVWIESSTDEKCVAKARRRGETEIHTSTWNVARAQRLGLMSKPNWQKQPAAMLMARATAEVCRLVAADVILGVGYSAEELVDAADPETAKPAKTAKRKTEPVEVAPPDLTEPELVEAEQVAESPAPEWPETPEIPGAADE